MKQKSKRKHRKISDEEIDELISENQELVEYLK